MQFFKHSRKTNSKKVTGQGMSEYLIIVGLIAVAGIAAMGLLGNVAKTNVNAAALELTGGDASTTVLPENGATRQGAIETDATTLTTLRDFNSHNRIQ